MLQTIFLPWNFWLAVWVILETMLLKNCRSIRFACWYCWIYHHVSNTICHFFILNIFQLNKLSSSSIPGSVNWSTSIIMLLACGEEWVSSLFSWFLIYVYFPANLVYITLLARLCKIRWLYYLYGISGCVCDDFMICIFQISTVAGEDLRYGDAMRLLHTLEDASKGLATLKSVASSGK